MRVISAVLLAMLGGKDKPTADDVKKILGSVGVEAAADDVNRLLKELEGKDIHELIAAGREKLQSVPSGGAVAAAAPAAGGAAAGGGGGAARLGTPYAVTLRYCRPELCCAAVVPPITSAHDPRLVRPAHAPGAASTVA